MENEDIEYMCLGSGSSGNCYVLRKNDEVVIVECGFEWKTLLKKFMCQRISLTQIKSVIITHEHTDHSKAILNFVKLGIQCYVPYSEKLAQYGLYDNRNVHIINEDSKIELASWLNCLCFPTCHDVKSFGFIFFDTENKQSALFINDTKLFDFKYKNYSYDIVFIECNHIRKQLEVIMQKALDDGNAAKVFKFKRQSAYHLSLISCKKFLKDLNLKKTKVIFLMHFSKECGQPDIMRAEIEESTGIKTRICLRDGGIQ